MRILPLLLSVLLPACGGSGAAFSHRYADNDAGSIDAVNARLRATPAPEVTAVAVGAASSPPGLWAYDLEAGRLLFSIETTLGTVPHVAGDFLVTEEGEDVVVRRLSDGRETARMGREGLRLVGASGEGPLGAFVLSTTGGALAESVLVVTREGGLGARTRVEQALGEPALRAGMIFVPWGHQNVSVLDAGSGDELARLRVDAVVGHAVARGDDVFVGQTSLGRFGGHLIGGAAWLTADEIPSASGAELYDDAYAPPPSAVSAAHHVRRVLGPMVRDGDLRIALEGNALYETFYRTIFAVELPGGRARWATTVRSDVVGASVEPLGLLLADETGEIVMLDQRDGRPGFRASVGIASSYVTFRTSGFRPSAPFSGDVLPVRDQLLAVASDTDARLVPARAFAVRLLGASPEPEVTTNLLSLCEDRSAAPLVHTAACDALAARTTGADAVIAALGRHAGFLTGTGAPPVGALARAAAAMSERRALPLLLAHLRDPETSAADLPALLGAVATLGDATALEPLADWLRLYHAEPDGSELSAALAAAVTTYAQLAGPTSAEALQPLIDDPMTNALLRERARDALAPPAEAIPTTLDDEGASAAPAGRAEAAPASAATSGRAASEEERERAIAARGRPTVAEEPAGDEEASDAGTGFLFGGAAERLPTVVTPAMIEDALYDFRRDLRDCLVTPRVTHASARLVLVLDPSGMLLMVSASPPEIQSCVEPLARSASYPRFDARGRQTVTYEIRR
jgi:hypothetical protein